MSEVPAWKQAEGSYGAHLTVGQSAPSCEDFQNGASVFLALTGLLCEADTHFTNHLLLPLASLSVRSSPASTLSRWQSPFPSSRWSAPPGYPDAATPGQERPNEGFITSLTSNEEKVMPSVCDAIPHICGHKPEQRPTLDIVASSTPPFRRRCRSPLTSSKVASLPHSPPTVSCTAATQPPHPIHPPQLVSTRPHRKWPSRESDGLSIQSSDPPTNRASIASSGPPRAPVSRPSISTLSVHQPTTSTYPVSSFGGPLLSVSNEASHSSQSHFLHPDEPIASVGLFPPPNNGAAGWPSRAKLSSPGSFASEPHSMKPTPRVRAPSIKCCMSHSRRKEVLVVDVVVAPGHDARAPSDSSSETDTTSHDARSSAVNHPTGQSLLSLLLLG
eukprot:GHVN01097119.1.p1 GENE.GHVN01097119.1~~GHVN01097119.1.p1  ORF type:complete len:387 (-),score=54.95 GHVN01097119.1:890-2050(-)